MQHSDNDTKSKPSPPKSKFWKLFSFNNAIRSSTSTPNHPIDLQLARKKSTIPRGPEQFRRRLCNDRRERNHNSSKRLSAFFLVPRHEEAVLKRQSCVVLSHSTDELFVTTTDDHSNTPPSPEPPTVREWQIVDAHSKANTSTSCSTSNGSVKGSPTPSLAAQNEASLLREELEKEKKVVAALQKQKEAAAKDLDYFGRIVEKLAEEKSLLSQRLELEKVNVQHKEQDMSILLEKMKATADDARDKSFEVSRCKQELKDVRLQLKKEQDAFQEQLSERDGQVSKLQSQLGKAEEQIEALKYAMEQLVKAHVTPEPAEQQIQEPLGSKFSFTEQTPPENPQTPVPEKSDSDTLDRQLRDLTYEKEQLQLRYSKIPISGGTRQSRRQKEELEEKLDKVDSQLSRIKQRIKRT
ncbi:hypothetical protein BJV82DRAFT_195000 [Fennellomyces sp. T-0311]|nr:hypothetical protein BJV82DRAFT_195000 [Fennellomyces sp. T-0311]